MGFERRPRSNWKESVGFLFIMATTKENSKMPLRADSCSLSGRQFPNDIDPGTVKSHNLLKTMSNEHVLKSPASTSWADRSEKAFNNNTNSIHKSITVEEKFFVIKRTDGTFDQVSPFLIQKAVQGLVGEPKTIKKLRTGELLIEVKDSKQSENLKKCTHFANIPISVTLHRTLNTSRGVISEADLQYITEAEILENLKDQNVVGVRKITIHRDNKDIPTRHIILTFGSPNLPRSIKAGYLSCAVRPYIPNPLRCFRCQRFGHSKASCRGKAICGRCSAEGHDSSECQASPVCVNCKENHPSYSRSCEKWKLEKEIQTVRTKQNISYPEARKIVESRTPSIGKTYAAATSKNNQKTFQTIATQTESICDNQKQILNFKSKATKENHSNLPPKRIQTNSSQTTSKNSITQSQQKSQPTKSKQNQKPTNNKNLTKKPAASVLSHSKKKKLEILKTALDFKKNGNTRYNNNDDDDALSIHNQSDLSDIDDEGMSCTSEHNIDIHI